MKILGATRERRALPAIIATLALAAGALIGVSAPASAVTLDSTISPTVAPAGSYGTRFTISVTGLPSDHQCRLADVNVDFGSQSVRGADGTYNWAAGTASIEGVVPYNATAGAVTVYWEMLLENCDNPGVDGRYSDTIGFTYLTAPIVTGISPNWAPIEGGTVVTITGTGLSDVTSVLFGTTPGTALSAGATSVSVTAPAHVSGLVDITVRTSDPIDIVRTHAFTYYNTPVITGISPTSGPLAGGTSVVITGYFGPGTPTVEFGTTASTSVTVNASRTAITAISPPGTVGPVTVKVTMGDGIATASSLFTYGDFSVTAVTPAVGSINKNEDVTFTGTNLTLGTLVRFGGTAGTVKSVSADGTSMVVTIPDHAAGLVTVEVQQSTRTKTYPGFFRFTDAPTITNVAPAAGSMGGGTTVVISGTNFYGVTGAAAVKFGAVNATSYVVDSDRQITAVSPVSTVEGTVRISVTNPQDTALAPLTEPFVYTAPTVTGLSPIYGAVAGGTRVVITGTFLHGATVKFGTTAATVVSVNTAGTELTVTAPAHAVGVVDVTVTVSTKVVVRTAAFTYLALPSVSDISPDAGKVIGGTDVVITGANLQAVTSVTFGGVSGTNLRLTAGGQSLTVTTPPNSTPGDVSIVITAANGTITLSNAFTYLPNCQPGKIASLAFAKLSANVSKVASGTALAAYARAIKASGCTKVIIKRWAPGPVSDPVLKAMKTLTQQRYLALVNQLRIQLDRIGWNVTFVKAKLAGQILNMSSVDQYPVNRIFRIWVG